MGDDLPDDDDDIGPLRWYWAKVSGFLGGFLIAALALFVWSLLTGKL